MQASAIRELAASKTSTWIAAAFFKEAVHIWDLKSQTEISEFPTVFCNGANNLALAPLGGMLVAGLSLSRGKVAAYEVPSGRKIWEQRLVYPSSLRFHPSGQSILCTRNQRSVLRLDINTGNVLETIDEASRYIEGSDGDALCVPVNKNNPFRLITRDRSFSIKRLSFALLDAQFSPHSVCLCEAGGYLSRAGGPIRCLSRVDGDIQWTFDPGADSHVVRLHYSPGMDAFFGILWNFEKGGSRSLMRFDPASGASERICEFDSWEEVFLDTVDKLVTSAGEIRALSNGALVGQLAFPQKEYPDS